MALPRSRTKREVKRCIARAGPQRHPGSRRILHTHLKTKDERRPPMSTISMRIGDEHVGATGGATFERRNPLDGH